MRARPRLLLTVVGLLGAGALGQPALAGAADVTSLRGLWTGGFNAAVTNPSTATSSGDARFSFSDTEATRAKGTTTMQTDIVPFPYYTVDRNGMGHAPTGRAMEVGDSGSVLGVIVSPEESASFFVVAGTGPTGPVGADGRFDLTYVTCGPATTRDTGPPYSYGGSSEQNLRYYEGVMAMARPSKAATPAAPIQQYGYRGTHPDEESPLCDQARSHPALFDTGTPASGPDTRRPTQTSVTCDGGPNPGDPFPCTVTVGDASANPGATVPTGTVDLTATSPRLSSSSCQLRPGAGVTATCSFTYTNPSIGEGQTVPVTASYRGDSAHAPSSGKMTSPFPPQPQQPQPSPPVTCGDAPLPSCTGRVPAPGPVQTCVGDVGGACTNANHQPAPIRVCEANTTDCNAFTGGAKFAGLLRADAQDVKVDASCPGAATSRAAAPRQSPMGMPAFCQLKAVLTAQQRYVYNEWKSGFAEEVRLRFDVHAAIVTQPTVVLDHLDRFTVKELVSKRLFASIVEHNGKVAAINAMTGALGAAERKKVGVTTLETLSAQVKAQTFRGWAVGPNDEEFYDPRYQVFPLDLRTFDGASAGAGAGEAGAPPTGVSGGGSPRAVGSRAKPRRVHRLSPKGSGPASGTITIASTPSVTVAAGAHQTLAAPLTRFGRALVTAQPVLGVRSLPLVGTLSLTSDAYAPTIASAPVTATIAGPPAHRSGRKKARTSSTSRSGASQAAK